MKPLNQSAEAGALGVEPTFGIPDSPFLTAEEASKYLRFASVRALYKAIKTERIPHRRRGRTLLFLPAELHRWLEGQGAGERRPGRPALLNVTRVRG